jgi:hypothetical protein
VRLPPGRGGGKIRRMKKKTAKTAEPPLPPEEEDFEYADWGVDDETIFRYLGRLLRPRLAIDRLAPAACKFLAQQARADVCGDRLPKLGLHFEKMCVEACRAQYPADDYRLTSARVSLRESRSLVSYWEEEAEAMRKRRKSKAKRRS